MVSFITTYIEDYFFVDSKVGQGTCRSLSVIANLALLAINKANLRKHIIEGTLSNNKLQLYRWSRIFIGLDILGTIFYSLSAIISITQLISILSILAVVTLSMNFFMNSNATFKESAAYKELSEKIKAIYQSYPNESYSFTILFHDKRTSSPEKSPSYLNEDISLVPITQTDSIID